MRLLFSKMKMKKLFLLLLASTVVAFIFFVIVNSPFSIINREEQLEKIYKLIHSGSNFLACKQPSLPVFAPEVAKFLHEVTPINCSSAGPDWVKCEGSECSIVESVKDKFGPIKCSFTDLIRKDDYNNRDGPETFSDSYYKLEASDVVRVSCKSRNNKWSNILTGIRMNPGVWTRASWDQISPTAVKYNVLMFGFDSLSRNAFIRKLPKSYDYIVKVLGGDVLQGYNIIGDGTPQALIPILTGKTELELPDTRKRFSNTQFVNVYPFIWNQYRNNGYVTAFFEDLPDTGTFTYRLNGFKEIPTDHYMRPFYLAAVSKQKSWPKLCFGDTPRHQVMFNQIKNFFSVYEEKPKFLFGFHGELSHDDYNLIGAADDDFQKFLESMHQSGVLSRTILIIMADHGHRVIMFEIAVAALFDHPVENLSSLCDRFAEIRNTLQGKQEERLPFFSFVFPESFKKHFAVAYENFRSNLDKLTTPFDIHETLQSMVNLTDVGEADISKRAVSLFTKIPGERSCAHAYIEPHWCACLEWEKVWTGSSIAKRAAQSLVAALNEVTEPYRYTCEALFISSVEWVMKLRPNDKLIKFKKNADVDGFEADLSAKLALDSDLYQIKVILVPGSSIFEASVSHLLREDKFEVKMSDVSRVNMYGTQARCVENSFPHLRKYCYCKD